jgi:hypothetical protein
MKKSYQDVKDEQLVEKTGKKISQWISILDKFKVTEKKSNEGVALLEEEYDVPGYWAKVIVACYLKRKKNNL